MDLTELLRKLSEDGLSRIFQLQNIVNKLEKNDAETLASCKKYIAENPYDGIAMFIHLMQKMKENPAKLHWDLERLNEVAGIVTSLTEFLNHTSPNAIINAEFDCWLQKHIVVSVQVEQYSEWSLFQNDMPEFLRIMGKVDEFLVSPQLEERFLLTFVFKNVRK